jgi:hypothetical protein
MCLDWVSNLSSTNTGDRGGVQSHPVRGSSFASLARVSKADVRRDMTEGAAWLPGSEPGMAGG